MTVDVTAPLIGEGVDELNLVSWKKRLGEEVTEGEALVELESDKVVTELPSPASGRLEEVLAAEGDTVQVGAVIARIDAATADTGAGKAQAAASGPGATTSPMAAAAAPAAADTASPAAKPAAKPAAAPAAAGLPSPLVRMLAAEAGIDPAEVPGTGAGGRITKEDVLAYVAARKPAGASGAQGPAKQAAATAAAPTAPALRPHSVMRRRIAERMIASQMTSAHVLAVTDADMGAIVAHRAANKEAFARVGVKLSIGAYFVYVLARALRRFPDMNSSWSEEAMVLHAEVNVGVAVSLGDGGLIVPVLRRADELDLAETARGIDRLAAAARDGSLGADEVRGGTFTLTNYGTTGSLIAAPIINQPQIGILGAGSIQKRPVVITAADGTDCIAIRPMVYLSLVFDHRALDGEAGSRFLRLVKEGLEGWT